MTRKEKLKQLIEMLKFALNTEDDEIIQSTIESVIETLEELSK
jgi:Asp-tRNA(Asn)/Glu-tRNA(Gln) amidotransferase C subunit